ncbi:serine hydrolase domain-containing protein [Bifidobacterium biavatii]|uniref:Penicillin-binding protein n=1 Tax=Bifidobacterium biavatii DSM 23969 TaxID=1437608 RepID=A0A087A103_9BIFI|nr:serine hydrolase domain-containing protein [Bifidobacterium biavatii]KFI52453.1 penicillin-binding protein [Bifidobacterium biavatii DSM 23969]
MSGLEYKETSLIGHDELQELLDRAIADYGVPGAQVGVVAPAGGIVAANDPAGCRLAADTVWSGIVNKTTGYPVQRDTLFQIGSISKIWTTVLAMQLVDEGQLSLDTRVKDVLPDFRIINSPEITYGCTIRHLMCHTNGIEGDAFPSTLGRGDDCVAKYVDYIGKFPARTPLGGPLSYSNGAFVVLGRVVEVLHGMTWDAALRKYIAEPCGFDHVWTLPEDVLRYSSALGHYRAVANDQQVFPAPVEPTDTWQLPRSSGPCGQVSASIGDLLGFATLFLNGGVAPNGKRVLSARSAELMAREQVSLREQGIENVGWALGWQLPNWGDEPAFGHGGATEGQRANIVVFPNRRIVVATLTNADAGTQMASHIARELANRAGIAAPPSVTLSDRRLTADEIATIVGVYERHEEHQEYREGGPTGVLGIFAPDPDDGPYGVELTLPLHATEQGYYAVQRPDQRTPTEIAFVRASDGRRYVASGHRVTPKVA